MSLLSLRRKKIIQILYENIISPMSGEQIGKQLNVTSRTIQNELKEISGYFSNHRIPAKIISLKGQGYLLEIYNIQEFQKLLSDNMCSYDSDIIPDSSYERVNYIIKLLLKQDNYLKLDNIADMLFISKSTINGDISLVKEKLKSYDLRLEKRPKYGLKIIGSEKQIRVCMAHYFFNYNNSPTLTDLEIEFFSEFNIIEISDIVTKTLNEYQVHLPDIGYKNVVIHLGIAINRIKNKKYLDYNELTNVFFNMKEIALAQSIIKQIEQLIEIEFPLNEIYYILLYITSLNISETSNVIDECQLVMKIINQINKIYKIDFSTDTQLVKNLSLHLKASINRIAGDILIENPYLKEVKKKYPVAFDYGLIGKKVIEENLNITISEHEVAYYAIHFLNAIEQRKYKTKLKVILVCTSGVGSAKLLESRINMKFATELDIVAVMSYYQFIKTTKSYDFVISTVPLSSKVGIQVSPLLLDKDEKIIRDYIKTNFQNKVCFKTYFPESLWENMDGESLHNMTTKEEVLFYLSNKLVHQKIVDSTFYNSLLEREKIVSTYLDNGIAIPHPINAIVTKTVFSILILNKPVQWDEYNTVSVIFLLAVRPGEQEKLGIIYDLIGNIALTSNLANRLKGLNNYSDFIAFLKKITTSEDLYY